MPTITIRLDNLPACCRRCLEKCPECVLRAELWRQATWQLSRLAPPKSPHPPVSSPLEGPSPAMAKPLSRKQRSKEETLHRAQSTRRTQKSRSG